MRPIALLILTGLGACTASWNRLVRYSDDPAAPSESAAAGVYGATIQAYAPESGESLVYLKDSPVPSGRLTELMAFGEGTVPGHWADTLKREVTLALSDSGLQRPASFARVREAANEVGIPLAVMLHDSVGSASWDRRPRIWLSAPGFNADSTIAAVRVAFRCGPLCGHGATVVLARRPGYRWRIWYHRIHWIS
jgi:hypothetical protein